MSISAAEALLKAGAAAATGSETVGLLGVLMVVTLVTPPPPLPVLLRFAGSDEGGVSGPLTSPDTKVALLKGALPLVAATWLEEVLELLLPPVDGFCSGMLSVSLSPPYFRGLASIQAHADTHTQAQATHAITRINIKCGQQMEIKTYKQKA